MFLLLSSSFVFLFPSFELLLTLLQPNPFQVVQSGKSADSGGTENTAFNKNLNNMCIGEVRKITAPSRFAYGGLATRLGAGEGSFVVPANSTIVYLVEVVDITEDDELPKDYFDAMMRNSKSAMVGSDPAGTASGKLDFMQKVELTAEMQPAWAEERSEWIESLRADDRVLRAKLHKINSDKARKDEREKGLKEDKEAAAAEREREEQEEL